MSEDGLITVESKHSFAETLDTVKRGIESAGMVVFAVFDHAAAASEVGLTLRPTTVIAFGNPAAGTRLMQVNQISGIDLPLKLLIWQDVDGTTKLTYSDPGWLAKRHSLGHEVGPQIAGMAKLLASMAGAASADSTQSAKV